MPTIPEMLDQMLAHLVEQEHRPCTNCDGRGVVPFGGPDDVSWTDEQITFRCAARVCQVCKGKRRIEATPFDFAVLGAMNGNLIAAIVMLRDAGRLRSMNVAIDWASDYQTRLRAHLAAADPDGFKQSVLDGIEFAERMENNAPTIAKTEAPSTNALTTDELRDLGLGDTPTKDTTP